jgi:rhodanese-related sulfurtransferase
MAQSIGYFQFDNLVKGRVPFLFVNLGVDTSALYPHVYKMHLERMQMPITEGDVFTQILERNPAKSDAIIVLCEDGQKSAPIAEALEKAEFVNVFLVEGGWKKLLADRAQS